jgi:hypothetical protein
MKTILPHPSGEIKVAGFRVGQIHIKNSRRLILNRTEQPNLLVLTMGIKWQKS